VRTPAPAPARHVAIKVDAAGPFDRAESWSTATASKTSRSSRIDADTPVEALELAARWARELRRNVVVEHFFPDIKFWSPQPMSC